MTLLALPHVRTHFQVYTIHKRFSSDKQDISRDIFFFEFQIYDVCTSSVRTSGHRTSNCLFLIFQGAILAQRLEISALHGVLNSLKRTQRSP
jgi:hypothetical protein